MQNEQRRQLEFPVGDDRRTLNVGIIGCGRIAEHHLRFIEKIEGVRLSALSDAVIANARRFAERYDVRDVYSSHLEMLNSTRLDVVHILTPPEFHYQQAADAIDRGVHVLLEKPCTIQSQELEDLYRRAEARGVRLCPDFILLFTTVFLQASSIIDQGRLGRVVHMEVHLSLDLNTPELREALGLPWRYNLPGGILHDNITHPVYMVLRWMGKPQRVTVFPQSHHVLPQGLTDHMSIMLEGKECTANIVISGVIKPEPYYIQIFCERGSVLVNFDTATTVVTRSGLLPRFLRRATSSFNYAFQLFSSGVTNFIKFAGGKLVPYQGLENLIPRFYDSIRTGRELPISKELAISVAQTEGEVFSQAGRLHLDTRNRPSTQKSISRRDKVLVTGATGYLGSVVVQNLVEAGYFVRALVRELSHTALLEKLGIELFYGDIRNAESVIDSGKGMDIVVHMAAALRGSSEFMLDCAVKGTRNVAEAAKVCGLRRVVYISSMSVYDVIKVRQGEVVSEDSALEEFPTLRGTYSLAKRLAEDEALSHLQEAAPAWTILRPSVIVGNGRDILSPVGKKVGNLLLSPGSAKKILRLIHVEDVASAIVNVVQNNGTQARVFNLRSRSLTQEQYVDEVIRKSGYENIRVIYIPYWLAKSGAFALRVLRPLSSRIPNIHKRRLASLYWNVEANSEAIRRATGWEPRSDLLQTLVVETHESRIVSATPSATAIDGPARWLLHKSLIELEK
jgi:predicted dehydrogenase/nucleoside-diphosphate-sugar epimerase